MSTLSTHVLDAVSGVPAVGVTVTLTDGNSAILARAATDDDGRIKSVAEVTPGIYRLLFDTASYFTSIDVAAFYPEVVIAFEVTETDTHYHVPLLLSPYAYSTYRGS